MKTVSRIGAASLWCQRASGKGIVVFVPTMGALHEGHAALIRRARKIGGKKGKVVVSIFVNPKQFGVHEDLEKYPQPFVYDRALCKHEGVDLLFHPAPEEMYSSDASITVSESRLSTGLCGASRPGHFEGVCTVVSMLFHIIRPTISIFGEKDWQQLAVIRRLVRDLKMPIKIIGHPIVREADGLALSSRNLLLTPEARRVAPRIYQALMATAIEAEAGETSVVKLCRGLKNDLAAIPGAEIDYCEIVNEEILEPLKKLGSAVQARVLVAVKLGNVRLIDNITLPVRFP